MEFYKKLKYGLMIVFVIIIGLAALSMDDTPSTNQSVSQPQTKFNF